MRVDGDAGLAGRGQIGGHAGADHVADARENRIDIGVHRIHPRWNENARLRLRPSGARRKRSRGCHLFSSVAVCARFRLRENVPVAIVVVADVVVIELRRRSAVIRRPARLAIPARDDIDAVRILRRLQQQDHVIENRLELRVIVFGQQPIGKLDRGVRRRDFGRMNRAGDHHDRLAFGVQPRGFGRREFCADR